VTPPDVADYLPEPAKAMATFLRAIDQGDEIPNTQWMRAARVAASAYGYLTGDALTDAGREQLTNFAERGVRS